MIDSWNSSSSTCPWILRHSSLLWRTVSTAVLIDHASPTILSTVPRRSAIVLQLHNTYSSWDGVHHQANKHSIVQNLNILCIVDEQEEDREAGKLEANLLSFVPSACSAAATEQLHGQLDGSRSCSDPSMSLSSLIWICSRPCTRSPKDQVTIMRLATYLVAHASAVFICQCSIISSILERCVPGSRLFH